MGSLNKVMLIGNLGANPEIRATSKGLKVATFSIATSDYYIDKNTQEKVEKTEWHRLVAWRQLAELVENHLQKGSTAYFEGKLQTRSWETEGEHKRYTTEVIVDKIQFLNTRNKSSDEVPLDTASGTAIFDQNDVPF